MRENALCAFLAGTATATMAWLGLYGFVWSDYDEEARPAFDALTHGHVAEFLRLAPAYGGSLVERAPFALMPSLWGGGELAVYRTVAIPCLLAAAALSVWLVAQMRSQGRTPLARAVTLGLCVANPVTLYALEIGHPEELLGACLCVAAVLLASREKWLGAGVLLGLAIANKEWALLALGPVLLALPAKRRPACVASASGVAAAVLGPLVLVGSGGFAAGTKAFASASGEIFQPWQLWWFFGTPNHVAAPSGASPAVPIGAALSTHPHWRIAPTWISGVPHPLILAVGLGLAGAVWLQRRRRIGTGTLGEREAMLLLALTMLLRCLLDDWDVMYYLLPFLFALLAWEARGPSLRPPVLALSSTALAWLSFQWLPEHTSPDAQAAFFLAWTLPLVGLLGLALFKPAALVERDKRLGQAREPLGPVLAHQR
ncbi:MAG: glycosyltransferase 87 family protein [Solirubrobacteraceae bacterium]